MTPDRMDALRKTAENARQGSGTAALTVQDLEELLTLAKPAIPSGKVAEDVAFLERAIAEAPRDPSGEGTLVTDADGSLSRLAAQAQSAHEWFAKWEQAESLLGELRKERDELRRRRDARERDLMLHFEAKNAALRKVDELGDEVATLRENLADAQSDAAANAEEAAMLKVKLDGANERAAMLLAAKNEWAERSRAAERRCADLLAAGQARSGKMAGHENCPDNPCPGHHPYCEGVGKDVSPELAEGLRAYDDAHADWKAQQADMSGWTMRDEFAKAAMQTGSVLSFMDDATRKELAQRAYAMADAMVAARSAKP